MLLVFMVCGYMLLIIKVLPIVKETLDIICSSLDHYGIDSEFEQDYYSVRHSN